MHRFKRLFTRFKKNPNGETVHIDEDLKKPENAGLQVLSRRFRTAQILLFLLKPVSLKKFISSSAPTSTAAVVPCGIRWVNNGAVHIPQP